MSFVESSFTIQFPEHVAQEKRKYCLDRLGESGATVHLESENTFRIVCRKPNELLRAGRVLFHSHIRNICSVIATSGFAEHRASAYPKASKV